MSYKLILFGALPIPEEIQRGDVQNLGTGAALTSFLQLPGGGWYDNYRDRKSPQGIRPISKSGLFWGTDDELDDLLMAWRAVIGVRARLTARMDNGRLMWQWARLQNVDTPRASNVKGGWLPFTLTWISAAQNWRGVVFDEEDWTWGDSTWLFGDGTAEMGVGSQAFSLLDSSETAVVAHGGNIDAPNLTLRFAITGTWQDITVVNQTTAQAIVINRVSSDSLPMVEINAGARSLYAMTAPQAATVERSMSVVSVVTLTAHGLVTGDTVRIEDGDEYNGDYYPATVTSSTAFSLPISPRSSAYGADSATIRKLTDLYGVTTFNDIERWMVMAPGSNSLQIIWSPFPASATLTAEFVDHYG